MLPDLAVLATLGERAGLERAALVSCVASDEDRDAVLGTGIDARHAGNNGVPFFIFNRKVAASGAYEPETLLGGMMQALKSE